MMRFAAVTAIAAAFVLTGCCMQKESHPKDRAMIAEFCPSYYHLGKNTPAEFLTAGLSDGIPKRAIYLLVPERFRNEFVPFSCDRETARNELKKFKAAAERGLNWPHRNLELEIPFLNIPPVIDGKLDADEWETAAALSGEIPLDMESASAAGGSRWYAGYDSRYLYFAAFIVDPEIHINREKPYEAASVELFVMPDRAMRSYWEFVINPANDTYAAYHMANSHGRFISSPGIRPQKLQMAATVNTGGYTVEFAVPFTALAGLGDKLDEIHFMMVRTGRNRNGYYRSAPVHLLYDGHNYGCYIKGKFKR